jgi:hypothetical protein
VGAGARMVDSPDATGPNLETEFETIVTVGEIDDLGMQENLDSELNQIVDDGELDEFEHDQLTPDAEDAADTAGVEPASADQLDELEAELDPSVLDCVDGEYGYDRTAGAIDLLEPFFPMPHDWTMPTKGMTPLSPGWHIHVVNWMAAERRKDLPACVTYPTRLSILVWTIYMTAPDSWTTQCRKGTAWALMINGLRDHGFRPFDWVNADQILTPPRDFFERLVTSHRQLADLIRDSYRCERNDH